MLRFCRSFATRPKTRLYERHQLLRPTMSDRQKVEQWEAPERQAIDDFKLATEKIFPKIERKAEAAYLEELKNYTTPLEHKEIVQSWKQREAVALTTGNKVPKSRTESVSKDEPRFVNKELLYVDEKRLNSPNFGDIGRYIPLSQEKAASIFRNGYFGRFLRDEYARSNIFNVMLREETISLIHSLKLFQNVNSDKYLAELDAKADRDDKHPELSKLEQFQEVIKNNAVGFAIIYKRLASLLNEVISERKDIQLHHLFTNSADLFDGTIYILVQELAKEPLYQATFGDSMPDLSTLKSLEFKELIHSNPKLKEYLSLISDFYLTKIPSSDILRQVTMKSFIEHISSSLSIGDIYTIDLTQYKKMDLQRQIPTSLDSLRMDSYRGWNTGALLTGTRGAGKSQILSGLTLWALNEGSWVVFKVPRASDFTKNTTILQWDPSGLYLQIETAIDLLKEFHLNNKDKLAEIEVNSELYGKYNIVGLHDVYDADYTPWPAQHKFVDEIQVWTDDWKQFYDEELMKELNSGIVDYPLEDRKSRFDYETELIDNSAETELVIQADKYFVGEDNPVEKDEDENDEPLNHELIFPPWKEGKLKPRKIKLPKSNRKDLIVSHDLPWRITGSHLDPSFNPLDRPERGEEPEVEERQKVKNRLSDVLPEPKNLLEIVEFALENTVYGTNAIFEVLEQLYNTEKYNVLIMVDEYNEFFKPSQYPSVKYVNYKETNGFIPPYDISLCRAFMRWDGHRIKNGVKIYASSEFETPHNHFGAEDVHIPYYYELPVNMMGLQEYRYMTQYYMQNGWTHDNLTAIDVERTYMSSQGNWYAAHQLLKNYLHKVY